MKIILLGCGYLGYNLSEELCDKFQNLLCIGLQSPYSALMYQRYQYVDVFNESNMKNIDFKDAIVIDALSTIDNHAVEAQEEKIISKLESSYLGLLTQLKAQGAKKFVFFSSGAVYGSTVIPADEEATLNPVNFYARGTLRLEKLIQEGPLDYLILRLASPYGGFRMTNKRQGVIPILLEKALNNDTFEMLKDENAVRDYFYITDFANALGLLIENEVSNEIINVGSGKGYSLKTIIEVVERTTGEKINIEKMNCEADLVDSVCLDIDKLQRRTGFDCEVTITSGVYKELNRILNNRK